MHVRRVVGQRQSVSHVRVVALLAREGSHLAEYGLLRRQLLHHLMRVIHCERPILHEDEAESQQTLQ